MVSLRKHDYTMDGSHWDLSTLSLSEAPVDDLKKNPKARKIDLSNNQMSSLPMSFTTLTHLVYLDLSKNQLNQLPEQFGDLHQLKHLDLYGNRLSSLPLSFGKLERLRWLDLKDNPLQSGLKSVAGDCANTKQCEKCAINVVKYVKRENERIILEMKQKQLKDEQRLEAQRKAIAAKTVVKEKKKAKNARRAARKANERLESNGSSESNLIDNDSDDDHQQLNQSKGSSSMLKFIIMLLRIIFYVSLFVLFVISAIAIALHLRKGSKLESFEDLRIALNNGFIQLRDVKSFVNETGEMFYEIINKIKILKESYFTSNK